MRATCIIFLASILLSACSTEKIISNWNDDVIIVDGNQADWQGKLHYVKKEESAVGAFNNNEFLYLCLTTDNREKIIQILNLGMTLWLDPDSGNSKKIGVKYPIPRESFNKRNMIRRNGREFEEGYIKKMLEKFQLMQNELQVVNGNNYSLYSYPINNGSGIKIKLDENMQQLVYEIRIPLADNPHSEFKFDASPGNQITIGFETEKFVRPENQPMRNMQPRGGIDGGRSGGRNGNMGARSGRGRRVSKQEMFDPLDIDMDVKLVKPGK